MARPPLGLGEHGTITTKRLDKGWQAQCRFRDADGVTRIIRRRGPTQKTANSALQDEIRNRAPTAGELTGTSRFTDAAELWRTRLDDDTNLRVTTKETYEILLRTRVLPALGELRLREIRVPQLDATFVAMRKAGLSPGTLRGVRKVIGGVLQLAVDHDAISSSPIKDVGQIKGGSRKEPRALTRAERVDLLTKLDGGCRTRRCTCGDEKLCTAQTAARRRDLPDLVRFLLGTGMRIGEALAVRWGDLDTIPVTIESRTVHVPVVYVNGTIVRYKGAGLQRHDVKTRAGQRTVPLPGFVTEVLDRRWTAGGFTREQPVFCALRAHWRDPKNTQREVREFRDAAGYPWLTSHTFRKTAATIWDEAKLTARQGADVLGHARVSMTQDVYWGRGGEVHVSAAAALDAAYRAITDGDDE